MAALTDRSDQWGFVHNRDISPTTQRGSIWPTTISAIASFAKLSKSALEGLRKAAAGGTDYDYQSTNGRAVAEYRWSGYVLATLLAHLEEKHQIDLMKSEELAAFLTNTTRATHFIFTPANGLEPKSFSEEAMRQYFNEFNATNEQEIGRAMLDGVSALRESLGQIEDSSVVVFSISENRQLRVPRNTGGPQRD